MKYPESSGITAEPITGQYFPNGMTGLYITVNCEDPEEIIKRLAWLSTEEALRFREWVSKMFIGHMMKTASGNLPMNHRNGKK